eukprot:8587034-Pyramimonas_sp.AAC.1
MKRGCVGRLCGARWPAPPLPCGVIAATVALSPFNPTSWMTSLFRMLPGIRARHGHCRIDR